jgi:peptide subunit release factor RF-3
MDREGKYPFDLLDELEQKLNIKVRPLSWPISMGQTFKGVYNLYDKSLYTFLPGTEKKPDGVHINNLEDPLIDKLAGNYAAQLREDVDLIEGVYEPFDLTPYREGKIAPVFFGSAINNFGVKEMLDTFIEIAPNPKKDRGRAIILSSSLYKLLRHISYLLVLRNNLLIFVCFQRRKLKFHYPSKSQVFQVFPDEKF